MVSLTPSRPSVETWNAQIKEGGIFRQITDTELIRFIDHCLIPGSGQVAVDAGCGTGGFSRQLHRYGYDVIGLDYAEAAIAAARRTPLPGVRYLHHDLNAGDPPGLPPRGIDLVVCRLVLPFLTHPYEWVGRVRDHWLRPGGRLYLLIPVVDEHEGRPGGMTREQIVALPHGWAGTARFDLGGSLSCLVLRSPA